MAAVAFGTHAALVASRTEQDAIRRFYREVLGCTLTRASDAKDDLRIGDNFYLAVLYADEAVTLDKDSFLKATYLELTATDVEEMRQKIVAFGVNVVEIDDPHLYFQAPGGQVFRLVGTDEDLSKYEGTTEHRELPSNVFAGYA